MKLSNEADKYIKSLRDNNDVSEYILEFLNKTYISYMPTLPLGELVNNLKIVATPIVRSLLENSIASKEFIISVKMYANESIILKEMRKLATERLIVNMGIQQLNSLLQYNHRCFVYKFLYHNVIDGVFVDEIKIFLEEVDKENSSYELQRNHEAIEKLVKENIEALMIVPNNTNFKESLETLIKNYNNDTYRQFVLETYESNEYYFPDVFLADFGKDNYNQEAIFQFIKELASTYTAPKFKELCLKYKGKREQNAILIKKIDDTYKQRMLCLSLDDKYKIDGLNNLDELLVANKLIKGETLDIKDTETLNHSTMLKNINMILDKYRKINSKVSIDNEVITITNNNKSQIYRYKLNNVGEFIDNKFSIFGALEDIVRETMTKEPEKSFLNQITLSKKMFDKLKNNGKIIPPNATIEERNKFNDETFSALHTRLSIKPECKAILDTIANTSPPLLRYCNPTSFDDEIIDTTDENILYILAEKKVIKQYLFQK